LDARPLPLYASTENRREWLHVLDHCRAIELVLDRGEPGETYNVGSGIEKSIAEIADAVLEHTGKPASLKTIVPDRPGHDRRYLLDSSQIHGFEVAEGDLRLRVPTEVGGRAVDEDRSRRRHVFGSSKRRTGPRIEHAAALLAADQHAPT